MGYDILSDDLFDDSDTKKASKKRPKGGGDDGSGGKKRFPNLNISPMTIHIILIVLLLLVIIFLLFTNLSFDFGSGSEEKQDTLTFIGELDELQENYTGDVALTASEFVLSTPNAKFQETKKDIELSAFNGSIGFVNDSIQFSGSAESVTFGGNMLRLDGTNFSLTSQGKTNLELFFENITFQFGEGRFLVNEHLRHEFDDATATMDGYNFSLNYDGTFSITGSAEAARVSSPEKELTILYGKSDS